jgi:hypothetical protein
MRMSTLNKRMQILIDESRMRRVAEAAANSGDSVGEWVRGSIDQRLDSEGRGAKIHDFIAFIDSIEPIDFGTIDDIRALRQEAAARPIFDEPVHKPAS